MLVASATSRFFLVHTSIRTSSRHSGVSVPIKTSINCDLTGSNEVEDADCDKDNADTSDHATAISSFSDLGVTSKLRSSLRKLSISDPNPIQRLTLPTTFKRGNPGSCVIQSETGSGKTLAYLLPALQDPRPGLTSLVVTPTRELAVQICYWARQLAGTGKTNRRVSLLVSGRTEEKLLEEFESSRPHVLIGTPKLLKTVVNKDIHNMGLSLQRVVLDEADVLLEPLPSRAPWRVKRTREAHPKPTKAILEDILAMTQRRGNVQLICTSATIPTGLQGELIDIGWEAPLPVITTNRFTKQVPQMIKHVHVLCSAPERKGAELVRHFKENGRKSALVFIHRDTSIKKFTTELQEMGVAAEALYANLDSPGKVGGALERFKKGDIELMVGNEETVRGLDFPFLETVYLTEVPRNATEYLHSAGRVGRCGRDGRVIVLLETSQELSRLKRMYSRLFITNHEEM